MVGFGCRGQQTKIMSTQTQVTAQANDLGHQEKQCAPEPKWSAVVDDESLPMPRRRLKARVVLEQAGAEPGQVLVRDLDSEHDVALHHDQEIDLAEGNVFYLVPECDAPKPADCHAPPKLAFVVDDRPEEVVLANQTGLTLRDMSYCSGTTSRRMTIQLGLKMRSGSWMAPCFTPGATSPM